MLAEILLGPAPRVTPDGHGTGRCLADAHSRIGGLWDRLAGVLARHHERDAEGIARPHLLDGSRHRDLLARTAPHLLHRRRHRDLGARGVGAADVAEQPSEGDIAGGHEIGVDLGLCHEVRRIATQLEGVLLAQDGIPGFLDRHRDLP